MRLLPTRWHVRRNQLGLHRGDRLIRLRSCRPKKNLTELMSFGFRDTGRGMTNAAIISG